MYDVFRNVILLGGYNLADMLSKIDTIWVQGGLADDQRTELITLAREHANPEDSYATLQNQVDALYNNYLEITAALQALTNRVAVLEGEEVTPEEPEEWPAYVQPTGAHDAYNTGDKITYNGNRYTCKMDGCVWPPDVYPAGWDLVTDQTADSQEEGTE